MREKRTDVNGPSRFDRRGFLRAGVAGGVGLAFGAGPYLVRAQAKSIPIVGLSPMSGTYAVIGRDQDRGSRLAVEDIGGKVLGRDIEYIGIDDEMKPGTAVSRVQSLVESKGAQYVQGSSHSGIALAVAQVAAQRRFMFWTSVWADEVTGTNCNKYTFRWSLPAYGAVRATVPALAKLQPSAKRWITVTPSYAFGDSLVKNEVAVLKQLGKEHVGNVAHPLGEREYSGHITKIKAARPDVVIVNNLGGDTVGFLKQAREFGLTKEATVLVVAGGALTDFKAIGAENLEGVYVGTQFWHDTTAPMAREVGARYKKKYGENISYLSMSSYTHMWLILDAMKRANSTELAATIAALEGYKYQGPTGEEIIRPMDHQVLKKFFLLRGKSKSAMRDEDDFFETLGSSSPVPSPSESQCKMPASL